jgi:peroxiredoxin
MPLALSRLNGDANVATRRREGLSGRVPACSVRRPDLLNSCVEASGAPLVLAFAFTGGGSTCFRLLDEMNAQQRSYRRVHFAAVFSRGDRNEVRKLIRAHHWSFPVGYDRDGAVASLYGIAGCPTVTYALPGGRVVRTRVGRIAVAQLSADLRALVASARGRGGAPR